MLKILTSLLILLNPVVGLFTLSHPATEKDTLPNEVSLVNFEDYKLPLSESVFLAAQLVPSYPFRNWNVGEPEITAQTALIFETSRQKILWQKNGLHQAQPIASLTKLMTALVVMENAKLEDVFKVSKQAVETNGEMGQLIVGEELTVKDLLSAMLIESSNDAAVALAENVASSTGWDFVSLMNTKAKNLGLANTSFADPSGLDPRDISSAWDLNLLMQEVLKYPVLQEITRTATADIKSIDDKFSHHLVSTDQLLGQFPEIIGGKTGFTAEAGNCMIVAFKTSNEQGTAVSIIMDSQDRTTESARLIQWTKEAFLW